MRRVASAIAGLFLVASLVAAPRPEEEQQKIDWLITEMKNSDAVFIRNGKEYTGERAASHVKSKLWFAGKRVQTALEFIVGVASQSEESGKPYEICTKNGVQRPLGDWLVERLAVYEKGLKR